MAFVKPSITKIVPDISNVSIYLRSTKKFGKTTLFRDVILEKYNDPSYGLLVGCGAEVGYKMLDGLNATQVTSWDDLVELKKWLIAEKGKEHNIKIVAFDTGDELRLLADEKTIRVSNKENPTKPVRSIKAALGGFTAGEKYSANSLIKPLISELEQAGFGVWVIAHTKMKTIKDKGATEEEGYQQLTSNLEADYEAAFGDCLDVCLTGVVDRELEERSVGDKKKNYVTGTVRKLYFRGTTSIDAGGRFADGSVPEYMLFDKPNMARDFIDTVEGGMEKSKINFTLPSEAKKVEAPAKKEIVAKVEPEVEPVIENVVDDDLLPFDLDDAQEEVVEEKPIAERIAAIKKAFGDADVDTKRVVKGLIISCGDGTGKLNENLPLECISKIEAALGI